MIKRSPRSEIISQKRILISKPTALGDVMVALPMATLLKKMDPTCHITFLARNYTRDLIEHYQDVDQFLDWEALKDLPDDTAAQQLAQHNIDICLHITPNKQIMRLTKLANMPVRIGTMRRWYGLLYCNRWMSITRKNVPLHEAQLDLQMLWLLGGKRIYSLHEIAHNYRFKSLPALPPEVQTQLDPNRFRLLIQPRTQGQVQGHAWNWTLNAFTQLIRQLPVDQFQVIITGSAAEGKFLREEGFFSEPGLLDLCGKLTIAELLQCISQANGMIAASTGPMHLAAALGSPVLGLFPPMRPYNTLRWGPVGLRAEALEPLRDCSTLHRPAQCRCIELITPAQVCEVVQRWSAQSKCLFL